MRALVDDALIVEDNLHQAPVCAGQRADILPLAVEIRAIDIHPAGRDDLIGTVANSNARDITAAEILEGVLEAEGAFVENRSFFCKF